ncbi:MAG TPA: BadF/BadG/BcrA/BcrD ATPase family protein, partial [Gemmataceae bacterium]|nr:BadF/BadG/BcrA/BcrD ATPase family protein [Gemmataceae bacterium]
LGKTHGNLMVDLRETNSKLRARSNRIVRTLTGVSTEDADTLLSQCAGELKTALIVQQANVAADEARAQLASVGGQVGKALRQIVQAAAPNDVQDDTAALCLGIDGGGTRTVALLGARDADGRLSILGRGEAGPSNLHAVGVIPALAALDHAVAGAFTAAKRRRGRVASACLGLAGAGRAEEQRLLDDWARRVQIAAHIHVTTDAAILLAAGTPNHWGLAIVAGTGSIAYGQTLDGRTARAGGWGYLLGDEGSGYALAVAALQAVARAADQRGAASELTDRLLERLKISTPQGLVHAVYQSGLERSAIAALAPLVLDAAEAGDRVATALVDEAAQELAQAGLAVASTLGFAGQPVPLALAGGVLLESDLYKDMLLSKLRLLGVCADPVTRVKDPAEGALRLALSSTPRVASP